MADEPRKVAVLIKGSMGAGDLMRSTLQAINDRVDPKYLWVIAGRHCTHDTHRAQQFMGTYPNLSFVSMSHEASIEKPQVYIPEGDFSPEISIGSGKIEAADTRNPCPNFDVLWKTANSYFVGAQIYTIGVSLPGHENDGALGMASVAFLGPGEAIVLDPRTWSHEGLFSRSMPTSDYAVLRKIWQELGAEGLQNPQLAEIVQNTQPPALLTGEQLRKPLEGLLGVVNRVYLEEPTHLADQVAAHIIKYRSRQAE